MEQVKGCVFPGECYFVQPITRIVRANRNKTQEDARALANQVSLCLGNNALLYKCVFLFI